MSRSRALVYLGLQRARGGVSADLIRRAAALLDGEPEQLAAHIAERLHAVHNAPILPGNWLQNQPTIERTSLSARVAEMRASPTDLGRMEWRRTSGSTGTPFSFPKSLEMTAWMDAAMWAVYGWWGISPGDRQARFWGLPAARMARVKKRGVDWIMGRQRLSAFEITPERSRGFFAALRRYRPRYAYGYPTLISQFVDYCTATGLDGADLGLRIVICTGELLAPQIRDRISHFFGCPVTNEYGCTESGVLAFACEHGSMHEIPVSALMEVVGDEGQEVESGTAGEVVVSDLFGTALPLLRYRLHDRATKLGTACCACGRALPIVRLDQGRLDNFILTPERGPVYDAILAYSMPAGVQRFRAFQRSVHELDVHLVPGTGFDASETPAECKRRLESALGPGMRISVERVDDLPYANSGKLQYFVPLTGTDPYRSGDTTV